MSFLYGKIINRSSVGILVIETTTNAGIKDKVPAVVHRLASGKKTPKHIDADGFKRIDGQAIRGHSSWWKIKDFSTAEITDDGSDLKFFVLWKKAVKEDEFGAYEIDNSPDWGQPINDVDAIIKDKKRKTIGYILENGQQLSLEEGISLATKGELDNVVVFTSANGKKFLKSKSDFDSQNNLRVEII